MTRRLFSSILVAVLAFCAMPLTLPAAQKTENLATYTNGVLASPTNFFDANSNLIARVAASGGAIQAATNTLWQQTTNLVTASTIKDPITNNYTERASLLNGIYTRGLGIMVGADWTNVTGGYYNDYTFSGVKNYGAGERGDNGMIIGVFENANWDNYALFDSSGRTNVWDTTQEVKGDGTTNGTVKLYTSIWNAYVTINHNQSELVRIKPTYMPSHQEGGFTVSEIMAVPFLFNTDFDVNGGLRLLDVQEQGVSRLAVSEAGDVVIGTGGVYGNGIGLTNIPFAGVVGVLDATNTLWQSTTNLVGVSSNSLAQSIAASTNNYAGILTNMTLSWSGKHTFGNVVTNSADVYMEGALHLGGDLLGVSAVTASGGFYGLDGGVTNASGQTILAQIKADGALNTNEVLRVGGLSTNHVYLIGANDTNHVHAIGANTTNHVWAIGANATNHAYKIGANDTNETLRVGALTTNHVWKIGSESTNETARVGSLVTNHTWKVGGEATNEVARVGALTTNHVGKIGADSTNHVALATNLYAAIVTNIAAYQAQIATNGLSTSPNAVTNNFAESLTLKSNLVVEGSISVTNMYIDQMWVTNWPLGISGTNLMAGSVNSNKFDADTLALIGAGGDPFDLTADHVWSGSNYHTGPMVISSDQTNDLGWTLFSQGFMATSTGTNALGYTTITNVANGKYLYQGEDGVIVGMDVTSSDPNAITNNHSEPVMLSSSLSLPETGGHLLVAGNQTNTGSVRIEGDAMLTGNTTIEDLTLVNSPMIPVTNSLIGVDGNGKLVATNVANVYLSDATNHVTASTNLLWQATTNLVGVSSNALNAAIEEMSGGGVTAATVTNITLGVVQTGGLTIGGSNTWTDVNAFTDSVFIGNGTQTNQIGFSTFTNVSNSKYLYQGTDGLVVGADAPAADLSPATNEVLRVGALTTNHVWLVGGNNTNETLRVGSLTTNHVWKVGGEATNEVARVGGLATNHTWKVGGETTNHVAASTNTLWQSTTNLVGISSNALQQAITSLTGGGITMADVRNQGMLTNNNAGAVTLLSSLSLSETGGNLNVAGNQTNSGQYLTVDGVMLVSGVTNSGNFSGTLYGDVHTGNLWPTKVHGLKVINDTNLADSVTSQIDQQAANHATDATNKYAGIFTNRAVIAWAGGHSWAGASVFAGTLTAQNGLSVNGDITCDSTIGAAGFAGFDEGITNAAGQSILAQIQADGANNTNEVLRVGALTTNHVHKTGANDTNHVWLVGGNDTNHVHKIGANTTNHVWKIGSEATNEVARAKTTIGFTTNIVTSLNVDMSKAYSFTNLAANITLAGVANKSDTETRHAVIVFSATSADRSIDLAAGMLSADGAAKYWVTNGGCGVLSVTTYGDKWTNVAFKPFWR